MSIEVFYHGSNRVRGERMISNQQMEISRGEKHWLGDGTYFFEEILHTFKWIVDMFKDKYNHLLFNYDNLKQHYLIIEAKVIWDKTRVFDLTKVEHKLIYDRLREKLEEQKILTDKYKDMEFVEGVVINYMFNEFEEYPRDFDVIKAMFIRNTSNYRGLKSRLGYIPQIQICVRNISIIKSILEWEFFDQFNDLEQKLRSMERKQETQQSVENSVYSLKRRNRKY